MRAFAPEAQLAAIEHRWGAFYTRVAESVLAGTWKPEPTWGGIASGMVDIAAVDPALPEATRRELQSRRAAIVAGTLKPFAGPLRDNAGSLRLASGSLDDAAIKAMDWFVEGVVGTLPEAALNLGGRAQAGFRPLPGAGRGPYRAGRAAPALVQPPGDSMITKRTALGAIAACAVVAGASRRSPRPGADQAEVGPRLRDLRAVPQVVGVGGRRDQEAHQRQVRDPGVPGLQPGQGNRHQPGPDRSARWTSSSPARAFAARTLPAAGGRLLPFMFRDADHLMKYSQERRLQGADRRLRQEDRQPRHRAHLLRRAPRHPSQQADQQAATT